jgi:ribosomal protein L11
MWDPVKGEQDYSKRRIIPVQDRVDIDPFEPIDIEAAKMQVRGTARSMGLKIV